ncbi:MAG: hypothetical protein JSV18_02190 [Candidatus Bathyarchaeota archaeon]|nr:MAG: hypothetical protein JSV18_02190 [Candidatus Bathyarchaeota archaeon]
MSLARKTIPYVIDDGSRGQPFTEDLQMASLYILADARRGLEPINATVLARYPLQLRRFQKSALLIDPLGLNKSNFKYNLIPDVEEFAGKLGEKSEEPEAFLKTLKRYANHFNEFSGQQTTTMVGLMPKPRKTDEVQDLIKSAVEHDPGKSPHVFDPVLNEGDIKEIFDALGTLKKDITDDEKALERAKRSLKDSLDITRKVLAEEVQNIKDSSARTQNRLKDSLKRKRLRLKKKLDRDIARLRDPSNRQTRPLREERTKRKRRLSRAEKRVERLKEKGDAKGLKAVMTALKEAEKKFKEIDKAVKTLEKKLAADVREAKAGFEAELKVNKDKIEEEKEKTRARVGQRQALEASIRSQAKTINRQIDALISKKRERLRSLSRFRLDIEVEDLEISIPFYVFQYGKKRFDFHPPVEVTGSAGLLSRFRRILADSLESKVNMIIKPQGRFTEKYLEKAVKALGRDNPLGQVYRQEVDRLNVFRSRQAVDMMMTGLMKMRRRGWINDSEYIRLQEGIVDQLKLVSQP